MNKLAIWPAVFMLLVLLISAAVATMSTTDLFGSCPAPPSTSAESEATVGSLDDEQADNATTIITVGRDLNVPPRGWVIAIATAIQESGLRNLDHGDRDSLGLFQQRPSMGWGTREQILDPRYAATAFYQRLLQEPGWETMPLTEAAQAVQRSAFPNAYAQHEPAAQRIVDAVGSANARAIPEDLEQCASNGEWNLPVPGPIVSGFRTAERPDHDGVDIAVPKGTQVRAAAAGTVVTATCNAHLPDGAPYSCDVDGSPSVRGCGWYLDLRHADGTVTRYCHLLTEPDVGEGDEVHTGQVIGLVGSSGHSSGPHLHLETHTGHPATSDNAVEPAQFFAVRGVTLE